MFVFLHQHFRDAKINKECHNGIYFKRNVELFFILRTIVVVIR